MVSMNYPEITVVVPVYNVEPYLHRCIDSVLAQTFKTFELVLVDDGSPDRCGAICDSYIPQCEIMGICCHVIHRENGGLSAARNSGIDWAMKNSTSQWITFLDSDDWLHPECLEMLYQAVKSLNKSVAIGRYDRVRTEREAINDHVSSAPYIADVEDFWVNNRTNATVAWGKLYEKSLFQERRYSVGKYHEDEFLTYRILFDVGEVAVVDAPLYHYFVNENSIMRLSYMKRLPDVLEAFSAHESFFKESPWQRAYALETEKYAEALSDAIWMSKDDEIARTEAEELRGQLRAYIKEHKRLIPFEKRKDIYIAAYPSQKLWIRVFGTLKKYLQK